MDREGFRDLLKKRKLDDGQIEASLAIAERFEEFLASPGEKPDATSTWKFCSMLIQEGQNTYDNLLAIARYGRLMKKNTIYVAVVELIDGAEAQHNLFQKVGLTFGEVIRDDAFAGIGVSQLGIPPGEKPYDMFPVIDRLVRIVGNEQTKQLLSSCLRDLPDEYFVNGREEYRKSSGIDNYLKQKHQSFVSQLERCVENGELFFSQEITDDVVEFVRENQEIESGVREGKLLYISKIPYNAAHYLEETNPTLKRYYACHCPWAREAIKTGSLHMDPVFCNCSGGFSKKPWEVIFGQTLDVEVLESVLNGNWRCRFAIYLPDNIQAVEY